MDQKIKALWPQLPQWKQAVLSTDAWPADLVVPQQVHVPKNASVPLSGADDNKHWQWELRSCPRNGPYVLRVWPYGYSNAHLDNRKGAKLTIKEAWEFALTNSMPRRLLEKLGLLYKGTHHRRRISKDVGRSLSHGLK